MYNENEMTTNQMNDAAAPLRQGKVVGEPAYGIPVETVRGTIVNAEGIKPGDTLTEQPTHITSLSDLNEYAKGTIVRFSDFAEGQPLVARVRRPSLLVLSKQGRIPNTLMNSANSLFTNGGSGLDTADEKLLADMYDICHIIAENCLLQPTLKEIEGVGLNLTDEQLMEIFNFSQSGTKALESFRIE